MERDTKSTVADRLQFAMSELKVVMGIAECKGECALVEETRMLAERMRECMDAVLQRNPALPSARRLTPTLPDPAAVPETEQPSNSSLPDPVVTGRNELRKSAISARCWHGRWAECGDAAFDKKIAKALVDEPEQVVVRSLVGQQGTTLQLSISANDLGKIIGKQGRTARSIRSILSAASTKLNKRYSLEILE